ncbi:MAG: rhodanese-like domain-containing protein [Planctomycetaceae bacterium]|nr:rhodanese-like domain-containing protein [Planctomycetaceae bacterium]
MTWYITSTLIAATVCLGFVVSKETSLARLVQHRPVPEIAAHQVRQKQLDFETRLQQARRYGAPEPTPDFVLVDVRSPDETKISVIPNALTIGQFEAQRETFRHRIIICYCTVGVRSEEYAYQLRETRFNAWNFKGSILEWCQQGFPLQTLDGQPTNRVHTYSSDYSVPPAYRAVW